jgi:hypothetical protein
MDTQTETPIGLADQIAEVFNGSKAPLKFSALKKALTAKLKEAGLPTGGKHKLSDADVKHAVDALVQEGKLFVHPDKKPDREPKYWREAYVSDEERAAAKAAEKARIASENAETKLKAKEDKVKAKAEAKAAEAERIGKEKAERVASTLRAKAAGLGKRLVSEKQLGPPKAKASAAEHEAFATTLEALLAEGKLHRHGAKFGATAPVVTHWYETKPFKKTFGSAVKAVQSLLESGKVEFDGLVAAVKEKLAKPAEATAPESPPAPPSAPAEPVPAVPPVTANPS